MLAIAGRLVNQARLASARSKVGTDPAAVAEEVVLDVLVDLTDAYPAAMAKLDTAGETALQEHLLRACKSGGSTSRRPRGLPRAPANRHRVRE